MAILDMISFVPPLRTPALISFPPTPLAIERPVASERLVRLGEDRYQNPRHDRQRMQSTPDMMDTLIVRCVLPCCTAVSRVLRL